MKTAVKVFCLFLAFSLEIRVRASSAVVESRNSVQNLSHHMAEKHLESGRVMMSGGAAFSKTSDGLHWLKGSGMVASKSAIRISSVYGDARCNEDCAAVFEKDADRLRIHALTGNWVVFGLRGSTAWTIEAGSSLDLMSVGDAKTQQTEFSYTVNQTRFEGFLKNYLELSKSDSRWEKIMNQWKGQVEKTSALYQDRAQRQIASYESNLRQQANARAREAAETRRIRAEFRKRNEELD